MVMQAVQQMARGGNQPLRYNFALKEI